MWRYQITLPLNNSVLISALFFTDLSVLLLVAIRWGSVIVNFVPFPILLSTVIVPSMKSTSRFTIAHACPQRSNG